MITEINLKKVYGLTNIQERLGVPKGVLKPIRDWAKKQGEALAPKEPEPEPESETEPEPEPETKSNSPSRKKKKK